MKHLYFLNPDVRHPKPKMPPEPFFHSEVERDMQSLRDGTGRYSTPKEDAILIGILSVVVLTIVGAICLCVHFMGAK